MHIVCKGTITVASTADQDEDWNNGNKKVIFNNCAPFPNCISGTTNTEVDDAHDIDVVMPMYNLTEHNDNHSNTSGILWQYCRNEQAVDANDYITRLNEANATTDALKIKDEITGKTGNNGKKDVKIMVALKLLFFR